MNKSSRIYIAGHTGLLGGALAALLRKNGYKNIITRARKELDLRDQAKVKRFFEKARPEYVALCAATVGGIGTNIKYPARFIYDNISINTNIIHSSYLCKVKRLVFFGSSCCYPVGASVPYREESLFSGPLEETSRPYAVAKLAGIEMCLSYNREHGTRFLVLIPATLYGPGDDFSPEEGHVLSSLLGKFADAKRFGRKEVVLWGTGKPVREFLYVDDAAKAVLFFMELKESSIDWKYPVMNIGCGEGVSIRKLAGIIARETGYDGRIIWDKKMPDGAPRKIFSARRMNRYGFRCATPLTEGIKKVLRQGFVGQAFPLPRMRRGNTFFFPLPAKRGEG